MLCVDHPPPAHGGRCAGEPVQVPACARPRRGRRADRPPRGRPSARLSGDPPQPRARIAEAEPARRSGGVAEASGRARTQVGAAVERPRRRPPGPRCVRRIGAPFAARLRARPQLSSRSVQSRRIAVRARAARRGGARVAEARRGGTGFRAWLHEPRARPRCPTPPTGSERRRAPAPRPDARPAARDDARSRLFQRWRVRRGGPLAPRGGGRPARARGDALSPRLTSLALGSYEEGWLHYGGRPHAQAKAFAWNRRTGEQRPRPALEGISVSVHGEQGLGDELFFMRFLAPLARVARRVSYRGDPRLRVLLERADIGCKWADEADDPPDLECLAGDLPFLLGHPLSAGFPPPFPVSALAERAAASRGRLEQFGPPPYLGVTWRAGFAESAQRADLLRVLFKRIDPRVLGETLARFPGSLVSVQRHPQPGELEAFRAGARRPVLDLSGANDDLEELIGVLVLLDDYVGVSSTNMHLRAGLGQTARVLAPMPPEWRWAAAGTSSPWFPGFAVYREAADTGWTPALRALSEDLARSGSNR